MYNFSKKQKITIGIIFAIVSIILINYVYSRNTNTMQDQEISTYEEENQEDQEEAKEENSEIVVHVAGAVKTEGIVLLQKGARVSEAIEKAGGTTEEADMNQVNLAQELEDGSKIYIPKKGENMETPEENSATQEQTSKTSTKTSSTKVNINKANQTELESLPGIGPSTASKIIQYRQENGKFKTIESIKEVSGIGDAKYNSIKDLINI